MSGKPKNDKSDDKAQPRKAAPRSRGDSVSSVLKSVYDDTLREDVPAEFRDLLSKLD